LILLGLVLLFNNLGWTTVSIWDLLQLWPILLIAGGLEILIGRRSAIGSVLVLLVTLVLIGGGLWLLVQWEPTVSSNGEAISESLGDAARAEVNIGFGVGTLRIASIPEGRELIDGTVELHRGERLEREFNVSGDTARLRLHSSGSFVPVFGWQGDKRWSLGLNRDVPMDLEVSVGVGDASIDLERMNLTALKVSSGVGRTVVKMPRSGSLGATVDAGVGEVIVHIPESIPARIRVETGLGSASVPSTYRQNGNVYTSADYEEGREDRLDLTLEAGIGRVVVRAYRGE
jgi:hypothetical protein